MSRLSARLFMVFWLAASTAQADDADWNLEQLMRELGSVRESRAHFVERKYLKLLKVPLEASGLLLYNAPDRLEKYTLAPKPERMVIESGRLVIENIARGSKRVIVLSSYPVLWGFVESVRATLKGDLRALQTFYRVQLSGDRAQWHLSLIPRDAKMQAAVELIRIDGHDQRIHSIEVREAQGDRSVMTIDEDGR